MFWDYTQSKTMHLSYVGEICVVQSLTWNYHSVSKYIVNEVRFNFFDIKQFFLKKKSTNEYDQAWVRSYFLNLRKSVELCH